MVVDIEYSKVKMLPLTQPNWSEMLGRQIDPGLCSLFCLCFDKMHIHGTINYYIYNMEVR